MDPYSALSGVESYWKLWHIVENWRRRHHEAFAAVQISGSLTNFTSGGKSNDFDGLPRNFSEINGNTSNSYLTKYSQNDIESESMSYDESGCENVDDEVHDNEDSDLEFVVSEEMEAFLEQSMRHKLELKRKRELMEGGTKTSDSTILDELNDKGKSGKKQKGNNKVNVPFKIPAPSVNVTEQKRTNEMALLYGEAAPKICGMETAIQLSYNRLCDHHKPVHWPCIPFRP